MKYLARLLIAIALLSGCKTLDKAPITHIYVIDTKHMVCAKRKITNKRYLNSTWVADLPIESCNGFAALSAKEYRDLRTYLRKDDSKNFDGASYSEGN